MRITRQLALWPLVTLLISWTAQADTLVVCTEASPDALNAQLSTANTSFDVSEQIADRLVEMKIGGSDLVPGLAESWTISPDGLTYTFKLRHGVKFQSNANFKPTRDFNADDVVFSFQRMSDKSNPFYQSANGNFPEFVDLVAPNLASVDKIDDYTVAFKLKTPLAPLLPSLSMQPFSIVSAEYAASLQKSGKLGALDQEPIGTGPFSFVQYQKDAVIRFRAFHQFWGENGAQPDRVAKVDNLVFAITPDASVRYAKLRTNECQIARYPNPADLPAMRANPDIKVQEAGDRRHQLHPLPRRSQAVGRPACTPGAGRGDRHGQPGEGGVPGWRHAGRVAGAAVAVGLRRVAEAVQVRSGWREEAAGRGRAIRTASPSTCGRFRWCARICRTDGAPRK